MAFAERCKRRDARKKEARGRRERGWRGNGGTVKGVVCFGGQQTLRAHLDWKTDSRGLPQRGHLQWGKGITWTERAQRVVWTTQFIPQAQHRRRLEATTKLDIYNNADFYSGSPHKNWSNTQIYGTFANDCWLRPGRTNHEDWMQLALPLGEQWLNKQVKKIQWCQTMGSGLCVRINVSVYILIYKSDFTATTN